MESPDTIHGRMKEGAHLAGYSLQRSMENLRWLLEDSRFKELSNGYQNVNDFLRDTQGAFLLVNIKPEERKQIAELIKGLQPKASQRAIADMVGAGKSTIARDMGQKEIGPNGPYDDDVSGEKEKETGPNGPPTPPAIPPDDYDAVEKEQKRQLKEIRREEKRRAATVPEKETTIEDVNYMVEPGDVWQLGNHRLVCGDAYNQDDYSKLVGDVRIDALITDPPYGIGYKPDWNKWDGSPSDFQVVIGDDTTFNPEPFLIYPTVVLFGANYFSDQLPIGGWICWDKRTDTVKDNMIGSPFELAWYRSINTTRKALMVRVLHGGVVNADSIIGNNEKRLHSTQKPITVMEQVIDAITKKNDVIIDPFSGVGTTLLACEVSGRISLSMEIDPDYVAVILERWGQISDKEPTRIR